MYSKILILRFPKTEAGKPIVCYLAKDYNLTFNILNASVYPRREGVAVLELSGSRKDFRLSRRARCGSGSTRPGSQAHEEKVHPLRGLHGRLPHRRAGRD